MTGRPLLRDLGYRNESVCRTCLLGLLRQRQPAVTPKTQPWAVRYISQTVDRRQRVRRNTRASVKSNTSAVQNPPPTGLPQQLDEVDGDDGIPGSQNFSARFFEQEGSKITEIPDDGAYEKSLVGLDTSPLKNSIEQIKRVITNKHDRRALGEVLDVLGSSWDEMRSSGDITKIVERLDKHGTQIDAEIEATIAELPEELREGVKERFGALLPSTMTRSPSRVPPPQIPVQPYTANQRKKISRLNTSMQRVWREMRMPDGLSDKHVAAIYKAYHGARRSLAHSWDSVPLDTWDFLWKVFSADEAVNPHRLPHVSLLARDMGDAKVALSPPQQLLTIEAVFVDGWESKALDNWKRCIPNLGDKNSETFKDFWELGVRMCCRMGDMEQAQRAVNKLLDNHSDPRILIPMVRTLSERGTPEDHERAWLTYRQMRDLLGQSMKLSDYDKIVSYFLTTNQTENALYAFVDMMSDGQVDLRKQKYLPSMVANKFFVGKWLKRLIGAGDLAGAHKVVDFMRQKGIGAAAIHLNGLVGAWQRSGGAENMDKADDLAWGMIQERVEFVRERKAGENEPPVPFSKQPAVAPLPRATLETFSLLAENYRVRDMHDRMMQLWDAFKDAEISPDAFMMNQLLESYIQANQIKEANSLYHSLVTERGVEPNPYTFSAMWKTLDINRLHHVPKEELVRSAEAARGLFAEAVRFQSVFEPEGMDGQLARKILHTFRRIGDNAGFLVALTSLKELFEFLPSETLVLEMILGTTRLTWDSPTLRRRLITAKRELDQDLLLWADNDASKLEGDKRGVALYEYLQKRFWPAEDISGKTQAFLEAARQMGVHDVLALKRQRG